ncbi:hypothetical protein T484DRAFT_1950026 [Baffinella frigidus]|nr:hypothetical protein T484DRAFT_1950026 [Cryptophyta sp. CCMP2293]
MEETEEERRRRVWLKPEPVKKRPLTEAEKRTIADAAKSVKDLDDLAVVNVQERMKIEETRKGVLLSRLPATRKVGEGESLEGAAPVSAVKWDKGQALQRTPTRGELRAKRAASEERQSSLFARAPPPRTAERAAVWDEPDEGPAMSPEDAEKLSWMDRIPSDALDWQEAEPVHWSSKQRARSGAGLTEAHLSPVAKGGADGTKGSKKGRAEVGSWLKGSLESARVSPDSLVGPRSGMLRHKGKHTKNGSVTSEDSEPAEKGRSASAEPLDRSETTAGSLLPSTTAPKTFWARLPSRESRASAGSSPAAATNRLSRMLPAPETLTPVDRNLDRSSPDRMRPVRRDFLSRGLAKLGLRW